MMFCPNCRMEFREGFSACSDCNVPLVAELPAESPVEDVTLVTVLSASNEVEIAIAQALLDGAGIPCAVQNRNAQGMLGCGRLGGFNFVAGPVLVQVRSQDVQKALEVLRADKAPDGVEDAPSQ